MKQKSILYSFLLVGLFLLGFALVKVLPSLAESEQVVCSNGTAISQYRCAVATDISVTCPSSKPDQFLVFQNGSPNYVDCIGMSEMMTLVPDMTCRRSNGQTYMSKRVNGCYQGDSATVCPSGYTPLNQMCLSSASSPSPSPSPSPTPPPSSSGSGTIICVGGTPGAFTEIEGTSCTSYVASKSLAIRCKNTSEVIKRSGTATDTCVISSSIGGSYQLCTIKNAAGNNVSIYATSCPAAPATPPPAPPPLPPPAVINPIVCPDSKARCYTENRSVEKCVTTCPGEFLLQCPASWNPADSILGEGNKTCKKDDVTLESLSLKLPTQTVVEVQERVVIQEVPTVPEEIPVPQEVNTATCQEYKTQIVEKFIPESSALIDSAEKSATSKMDMNFKKDYVRNLKDSITVLRKVQKDSKNFQCTAEFVSGLDKDIDALQKKNLVQVREDLGILKRTEKEQLNLFGIRQDIRAIEQLLERVKPDKKAALAEEVSGYDALKNIYDDFVTSEGLVLDVEIQETAEAAKLLRQKLETKLLGKSSSKSKTEQQELKKKGKSPKQSVEKKAVKKSSAKKKLSKKDKNKKKKSAKALKNKKKKSSTKKKKTGVEVDP